MDRKPACRAWRGRAWGTGAFIGAISCAQGIAPVAPGRFGGGTEPPGAMRAGTRDPASVRQGERNATGHAVHRAMKHQADGKGGRRPTPLHRIVPEILEIF